MWPWILQDWEGSSGSFYDQPAAWTGAGGAWLVWDFFLEGIILDNNIDIFPRRNNTR